MAKKKRESESVTSETKKKVSYELINNYNLPTCANIIGVATQGYHLNCDSIGYDIVTQYISSKSFWGIEQLPHSLRQ